jgi:hypothetical protein
MLEAIEATSDELLGVYTKAKDEAMNTAFGARGKRRLNRVFDVMDLFILTTPFLLEKKSAKESCSNNLYHTKAKESKSSNPLLEVILLRKGCKTTCIARY